MSVLGVVNRFRTGLDVGADAVVVASSESFEIVESVDGDSIFRGVVADCGSVAGDVAFGNIVGCLSTNQKTVTTENGVGGECRSLRTRNDP